MRRVIRSCDHSGVSQLLEPLIVRHTRRVPVPAGPAGAGDVAARQLDAALMAVGFKLSAELMEHLSGLKESTVVQLGARTLDTVRKLVGDHVAHNVYFIDFPLNVPDTLDFWTSCILGALADEATREATLAQLSAGVVDLLTLPSYGRYQHTYAAMLAAHDELIAAAGDRLTLLHLGGPLEDEVTALYLALAGSRTPLGAEGLIDLAVLAEHCAGGPQPAEMPVRENRAVVNAVRVRTGGEPVLDTVADVLRLACALSGGDVTLAEPTRFRALSRPVRRALLAGLDAVVGASPVKLADVIPHREPFKRLGEALHPHEYPRWPHAAAVFDVARGDRRAQTFDSRVAELLGAGDVVGAASVLAAAPGKLFRALDHLLRVCRTPEERDAVAAAAEQAAPQVSGRVLLSVREHLHNRVLAGKNDAAASRVFVNRHGGGWVTGDGRADVPADVCERLIAALDAEVGRRLPAPGRLLVDPDILDVALPLSGKASAAGLGVLPRGSRSKVDGDLLRFFTYWKQSRQRTDYDLSALLLDAGYGTIGWLSYTELTQAEGEHSGDITQAPHGASEFINLRLAAVRGTYIVPQVNIYAGEGFEQVEESFFGYMLREAEQQGQPFEARTVRMKSDLRGPGRVALPLAFVRSDDGTWHAKWLHLYLRGQLEYNQVEGNRVSVSTLLRGVVEHDYLTIGYLVGLMTGGAPAPLWDGRTVPDGPVTFFGLERPEGLHPDSVVYTPENLRDVIPA